MHRRRILASVTFVVLRDRSGLAQVVVKNAATIKAVQSLPEETVVEVTGTVRANPSAPGGTELVDPTFTALTEPALAPPAPLWRPTFEAGLPTQLDHAAVTLRHPRHRAAWQIASASMRGFRSALSALEFTEIATPKLVGTATESGATVFTVDYFGRTAYLAQSPQLYKQMLVGVFERVFEVGPVFRAEPHDTVRHLAQYTSLDAEMGFIRNHRDVLAVLRTTIAGMVGAIETDAADAAALLGAALPRVPEEFPVIHFRDALARVGADPDEPDLSPSHERALSEWAKEVHDSDFLAVEGYPMAKRPFYTHPQPDPAPRRPPGRRPTRGARAVLEQLRPALSRSRADHRWAAPAPAERLRGSDGANGDRPDGAGRLPRGVRARDAAARRVRDRLGEMGRTPCRRREHPRGGALSARPHSAGAVSTACAHQTHSVLTGVSPCVLRLR